MFAPTLTYAYATYKGQQCLVAGYQERVGGALMVLCVLVDGGDLVLAELADVKIDATKLVRTDRR